MKLIIILGLCVVFSATHQHTTSDIDSHIEMALKTGLSPEKVLFVFNVDDTLLTHRKVNSSIVVKKDQERRLCDLDNFEVSNYIFEFQHRYNRGPFVDLFFIPTQSNFSLNLKKLKQRGVKTLAINTRNALYANFTLDQMKVLDFDFSLPVKKSYVDYGRDQQGIPDSTDETLERLVNGRPVKYVYHKGILTTHKKDEGPILKEFLKTNNLKFDYLFFIDSTQENLESVKRNFQFHFKELHLIHYQI